jgi:hypothetical protein
VTARKHGVALGELRYRQCGKCGLFDLHANQAIQRADNANAWVGYIKRTAKSRVDPEIQAVKQFFADAASKTRRTDPRVVDAFLAADRELRTKERQQEAQLAELAASLSLLPGHLIPGLEEDQERDREAFERTAAQIAARDQERAAEAEERERADEARRGGDVQVFEGGG